ncbi:hypothetical protein GJU40_20170, partial [Bacillus lacus]|nr:hypothetical protein [Metabacillus lacus]
MDLNDIHNLIKSEFKVMKREKGRISVAPAGEENYPETTVQLIFENHHYDLYEVDRGIEYKVESFSDEYQST